MESVSTFCMDGLLRLSEVFRGSAEMCLNADYAGFLFLQVLLFMQRASSTRE